MRKILWLLSATLVIMLPSCGDDSGNNSESDEIMPLKIGYEWQGTESQFSESGDLIYSESWSFRIVDTVTVNNEKWFIPVVIVGIDTTHPLEMYTNREDGLWIWYTGRDSLAGQPVLWAKYPAEVADSFISGAQLAATVYVESIDEKINAPYGEYFCHSYRWRFDMLFSPIDYYWLAPNMGMIKWEKFLPGQADNPYLSKQWKLETFVAR